MKVNKYFLLTTEFPPFYGGGIATYAWHTAQMLSENGIEVTVLLPETELENEVKIEQHGKLRIVRFKSGSKTYYSFLGWVFAQSYHFAEVLKEIIEKEGSPDIVEIQDYLATGYYLLQRKYALEKPFKDLKVLMTLHTPKFLCDYYNESPIYKFPDYFIGEAEKWCIKAVDGIVSPSRYLFSELAKYEELKDIEAEVIPNPYKFENIWQEPKNGRDLVFFGRLEKRKGVFEVLDYMKDLWQEGLEVPIYLIGGDIFFYPKGRYCSELIQQKYGKYIKEGYLVIEGKLKPEILKERLKNKTKIGIIGSIFENFPYALLELIENGVIAFVSDSGGQAEVIEDEKSGFVFSHKDIGSFKEKLLKILSLEDTELKDIRKKAIIRAKQFCEYKEVFDKKAEFLEKILTKNTVCTYPFLRQYKFDVETKSNKEKSKLREDLQKDLLSVVIPYYNLGKLLLESIECVEKSKYPYKEIIVVNDGSDDEDSLKILEELSRIKPYIKIINKPNEGLALARNTGAVSAKGEFLAFLDSDDMVAEDYYSLAIEILKNYENVSFVGCWVNYFEGSTAMWPTFHPEFPYILFHNSVNSSSLVLRTADFLEYGLNDPDMKYGMEDYDYVLNLLKNAKRGVVIPKFLFYYRVRKDSMLRQFNPYTYLYLYDKLSEKHKELYKRFEVELFNLQNANGPAFMIDNPTWESPIYNFLGKNAPESSEEIIVPPEIKEALKRLWKYKVIRLTSRLFLKFFR